MASPECRGTAIALGEMARHRTVSYAARVRRIALLSRKKCADISISTQPPFVLLRGALSLPHARVCVFWLSLSFALCVFCISRNVHRFSTAVYIYIYSCPSLFYIFVHTQHMHTRNLFSIYLSTHTRMCAPEDDVRNASPTVWGK